LTAIFLLVRVLEDECLPLCKPSYTYKQLSVPH